VRPGRPPSQRRRETCSFWPCCSFGGEGKCHSCCPRGVTVPHPLPSRSSSGGVSQDKALTVQAPASSLCWGAQGGVGCSPQAQAPGAMLSGAPVFLLTQARCPLPTSPQSRGEQPELVRGGGPTDLCPKGCWGDAADLLSAPSGLGNTPASGL